MSCCICRCLSTFVRAISHYVVVYCSGNIRRLRAATDSEQYNLHSGNTSDPVDSLSQIHDQKGWVDMICHLYLKLYLKCNVLPSTAFERVSQEMGWKIIFKINYNLTSRILNPTRLNSVFEQLFVYFLYQP